MVAWIYNLMVESLWVKSDFTLICVACILGHTEYNPSDINRSNTVGDNSLHCKTTLMWICLYIPVTTAHDAWLNTHIRGL